jgi:hypothetical protein
MSSFPDKSGGRTIPVLHPFPIYRETTNYIS